NSVDARGDPLRDLLADIYRGALLVEAAEDARDFANARAVRFLEHAIDDAAAATTAENHGIGALEDFDAFDVVEIAEILHVVADAVDEEVSVGTLAADHDIVAIAFALMRNDAGHVPDRIFKALARLIAHEILGDHGNRL